MQLDRLSLTPSLGTRRRLGSPTAIPIPIPVSPPPQTKPTVLQTGPAFSRSVLPPDIMLTNLAIDRYSTRSKVRYTNDWTVGLITNSHTWALGGSDATKPTAAATSSAFNIVSRRSALTGCGRYCMIGVSTSPG